MCVESISIESIYTTQLYTYKQTSCLVVKCELFRFMSLGRLKMASIAVVGAGVIGLSTAYRLQTELNARVTNLPSDPVAR